MLAEVRFGDCHEESLMHIETATTADMSAAGRRNAGPTVMYAAEMRS